jgi:hypothetical protein
MLSRFPVYWLYKLNGMYFCVLRHALPEILLMPCACDTRRNRNSAQQLVHRVFAHGEQHTATNAMVNILCRGLFRKPTAKYLSCAALGGTAK